MNYLYPKMAIKNQYIKGVILSTLIVALTFQPQLSEASSGENWGTTLVAVVGLITAASVSGVGGIVSAVGMGTALEKDERPSKGWLTTGYIFGALNILGSAAFMTATLASGVDNPGLVLGIGMPFMAIGGLDLGLAIWGTKKPKKNPTAFQINKALITPFVAFDHQDKPAYGIGLRLVTY